MKRSEIAAIEAQIKSLIVRNGGNDEADEVEAYVAKVTGPAVGVIYDPEKKIVEIAEGWIVDNDDNIVQIDQVTGPGTGMVYRDGKLVKAH